MQNSWYYASHGPHLCARTRVKHIIGQSHKYVYIKEYIYIYIYIYIHIFIIMFIYVYEYIYILIYIYIFMRLSNYVFNSGFGAQVRAMRCIVSWVLHLLSRDIFNCFTLLALIKTSWIKLDFIKPNFRKNYFTSIVKAECKVDHSKNQQNIILVSSIST